MSRIFLKFCLNIISASVLLLWAGYSVSAEIEITLTKDMQHVYEHPNPIKRVAVADPAIGAVSLINSKSILITSKGVGATKVNIWESATASAPTTILNIIVNKSVAVEVANLKTIEGMERLEIKSMGNAPALSGSVNSLESHATALNILKQDPKLPIDMTEADFSSHVQIDIKIVEVSRQNVMRFGLFLGKNSSDSNPTLAVSTPGNLSSVNPNNNFNFNSGSGFLPVLNAFNIVMGNKGSGLLGTLSVLESNGYAYTLAEPSISAISGQTASFLAGGEFPVPIRNGGGVDSAVTIIFKEFGVRLQLTPTVLSNKRIFMKISPEVSELDFASAVQTGGVSVPGLRVRRTDTSVSMGDGESFVISGMVSRSAINNVDQFPGLGKIPFIGAFFQSKRFDREDKELLMVVTPHLVNPINKDAKLPDLPGQDLYDYRPSFSEFFFNNDGKTKLPTGMSN